MKTNSAGQVYGIKYIFHFTAFFSPYFFTVFGKLSKIATVQYVNANRFISHNMRSYFLVIINHLHTALFHANIVILNEEMEVT